MKWYYVQAGQQAGPVSETELASLVASGTIKFDTLVWREGMANWVPYSQVAPAAGAITEGAAAAPAGTSGIICSECGKPFPPNQVIQVQGKFVCGNCKPIALQRVQEGVTLGTVTTDPDALVESILRRGYSIPIFEVIGEGWNLVKSNLWLCIGATVLIYGPLFGLQILQIIPMIGQIISLFLLVISGPCFGGLFYFYLKLIRGEEATIGDAFSGFKRSPGQLILASIVTQILTMLATLLAILPAVFFLFAGSRGGQPNFGPVFFLLFFLGLIPAVYLGVAWFFTVPLVADKGFQFWKAMQVSRRIIHARWWNFLVFLIVVVIVAAVGALGCLVGLLVTIPIGLASLMVAYDRIFNFEPQQPVL